MIWLLNRGMSRSRSRLGMRLLNRSRNWCSSGRSRNSRSSISRTTCTRSALGRVLARSLDHDTPLLLLLRGGQRDCDGAWGLGPGDLDWRDGGGLGGVRALAAVKVRKGEAPVAPEGLRRGRARGEVDVGGQELLRVRGRGRRGRGERDPELALPRERRDVAHALEHAVAVGAHRVHVERARVRLHEQARRPHCVAKGGHDGERTPVGRARSCCPCPCPCCPCCPRWF